MVIGPFPSKQAVISNLNERQGSVAKLAQIGEELSESVSATSGDAVAEEVGQSQSRFEALTSHLEGKLCELLKASEELGIFSEERNEMTSWLCLADNSVDEARLMFEEPSADRRVVQDMRVTVALPIFVRFSFASFEFLLIFFGDI